GFDREVHLIAVEADGHVELEVRRHLDAGYGGDGEGHESGRRVDAPAGDRLDAVAVDLHRSGNGLGDDPGLDLAAAGVGLHELERLDRAVALPDQLGQ